MTVKELKEILDRLNPNLPLSIEDPGGDFFCGLKFKTQKIYPWDGCNNPEDPHFIIEYY